MIRESEVWRDWPLPEPGTSLHQWQASRCAWCGCEGALVKDHCHHTGLVRGLLCRGCNNSEGFGGHAWRAWRDGDHPARAIGHIEVYTNKFGLTGLYPETALSYYTFPEQVAWWEATCTAIRDDGADWPLEAPWTEAASVRREADVAAMKAAIASLGRLA